jgi:hypothetical protein
MTRRNMEIILGAWQTPPGTGTRSTSPISSPRSGVGWHRARPSLRGREQAMEHVPDATGPPSDGAPSPLTGDRWRSWIRERKEAI